jgi:hypothetical protein
MPARISGWSAFLAALAGLAMWLAADSARGAALPKQLPAWPGVDQAVVSYFEALPGYQPGALIVRSEVRALLRRLEQMGWRVAEGKEILALVPGDGEFLATALRTPGGRKFMSRVAQYPDGYDRLDRLSRLPRGQRMVQDLIRGPDGYKLIEYMTTTPGGFNLGSQLANAPDGRDFNKPTGRIYTVKMLRQRLYASYQEAAKATAPSHDANDAW